METEIVLGPPGTGKTTYLLEQMEQELDRGIPPDRIGFVSFTRRAAQEAKDRAKAKFKLGEKDLPWVRTLHSLCFRALGLSSSEVLEGKKLKEFGDWAKIPISGFVSMDEGSVFGYQTGDRILFIDNLARVRNIPLREQYNESYDGIPWVMVETMSKRLADFKKTHSLMDYTDMLSHFVETDWSARLEVLFVDEAQDLSWLQWQVVEHLAKGTRRVVVAGDDDQAIYRWAGAAVEHFIGLPGKVTVLDHSWRVPLELQEVALRIRGRIRNRREKDWNPREGEGVLKRAANLEGAGIDPNEDTLILARNSCFLRDDAARYLQQQGLIYEYKGHTSIRQDLIEAVRDWERLRRGEEIMVLQAETIYKEMAAGVGYSRGNKKLPAWEDREQLVTLQDLKEAGGLLVDGVWHEVFKRATPKERQYIRLILRHGQRITRDPNIRISTIHGAKGAQADHVVILTDRAWRTFQDADKYPDDEARTWYVATTRAKQKMTIVYPQAKEKWSYPVPTR
jgi:ATP-dependent DNA helicase UvrD/PcrA